MGLRATALVVLSVVGVAAACYTGPSQPRYTYYRDVAPIIQNVCQNCHVAGGIAPFPLATYEDAVVEAQGIVTDTSARIMPPFGARTTDDCQPRFPFKHDWSLTDDQIATIKAWHEGGDLEGDPADAPPPSNGVPVTDLPNAISLAPDAPFSLPANQAGDYFECFVLDPKLTAPTYLTGTHVKPGNPTIVHHALIFEIPAGSTFPVRMAPGAVQQYPCFGSAGVEGEELVAAWTPGGLPYQYPDGVAHPLAAGTKFVMQIHYHPHSLATPDPDRTTFQFSTSDTTPAWTVDTKLVGNFPDNVDTSPKGTGVSPFPFAIVPNESNQIFTMVYRVPKLPLNAHVLAVAPHMHLVGVHEQISLFRASPTVDDPQNECLVEVPQWSFNWQRAYEYDTDIASLPSVATGDQLRMQCTYDDTMDNLALVQALTEAGKSEPQPVTLGESTLDEMCLGAFWLVYPTVPP